MENDQLNLLIDKKIADAKLEAADRAEAVDAAYKRGLLRTERA